MDRVAIPLIEWSAAARGESPGVVHTVVTVPHGVVVAMAVGVGGGPEAADAARVAIKTIEAGAFAPLPLIIHDCHEALVNTPGVSIGLALFDKRRPVLWWSGVGAVSGYLVRVLDGAGYEPLPVQAGIVGRQLPSVVARSFPIHTHDTLITAAHGTGWDPNQTPVRPGTPQHMAQRLVESHDAEANLAVLVARYLGPRDPHT